MDRLTFDAHIIATGTSSYRLRTAAARQRAAGDPGQKKGPKP